MFQRKLITPIFVGLFVFSTPSFAGLEEGIEAANKGQFKEALAEFTYLADMNYGPGIYELAKMHEGGFGVIKNHKKAAELFQKAVKLGVADAMFSLAVMHDEGRGVKKDKQMAIKLFKRAAKKELPAAQYNLGVMYANGEGVIQDYNTAMDWYEKAAAHNHRLAQFNLALMYFEGQGVTKNIKKSYIWNTIAEFNGLEVASKSRVLDEKNMSPADIKSAQDTANKIYELIQKKKYFPEIRPKQKVW